MKFIGFSGFFQSSMRRKLFPVALWLILGFFIFVLASIPIKIFLTQSQFPNPQAILVLSGQDRTTAAIDRLWDKGNQALPIWVSDLNKNIKGLEELIERKKIPRGKVILDGRATDTVTNFTTLVEDLSEKNIKHLYLVTHDVHMLRSRVIATIVLGSRGIVITPFSLSTEGRYVGPHRRDRFDNVTRDGIRSLLWLFTGKTGASLKQRS
jgi:uncharacterized SAM-binding protein YcdF (DUF218 family)